MKKSFLISLSITALFCSRTHTMEPQKKRQRIAEKLTTEQQQAINEALLAAARQNDAKGVANCLAQSANVDYADHRGTTALMLAACCGNTYSTRLFSMDTELFGLLDTFISPYYFGHSDKTVRLPLQAGAKVNKTNNAGKTALMQTSEWDCRSLIVRALLEWGADASLTYGPERKIAIDIAAGCGGTLPGFFTIKREISKHQLQQLELVKLAQAANNYLDESKILLKDLGGIVTSYLLAQPKAPNPCQSSPLLKEE